MGIPFSFDLDKGEKLAKIAAVLVGGLWVYFNTIRGRTFIPRLQPTVSGKLVRHGANQYLLANMQVQNIGSSIARVKARGTGLKVIALQAFDGAQGGITDLNAELQTAFTVFDLTEGNNIAMEPQTILRSEELIEVPPDQYDAFRLELRVSAVHGGWFPWRDRKWRAFAIVVDDKAVDTEKSLKGVKP